MFFNEYSVGKNDEVKDVSIKQAVENNISCIKRIGNGGALTSNDEGVIILEGNQFSINNNIINCTSSCYPAM